MNSSIYITTKSLKELLGVFNESDQLTDIILGDTCHPSSGFVDEGILNGKTKVNELLKFNYEFSCLIEFKAQLDNCKIELISYSDTQEEYKIQGPAREIEKIRNKIIEINALLPETYDFSVSLNY